MRRLPALLVLVVLVPLACGSSDDASEAESPAGGGASGVGGLSGASGVAGSAGAVAGKSGAAGAAAAGTGGAAASAGSPGKGGAAGVSGGPSGAAGQSGAGAGSAGAGAGGAPPGTVPAFIAQGHLGRTTISCDGGKTWTHDHSVDDKSRCFENGLDCDHSADAGRGIAYGNGTFVLTWGWGKPGTLQRSKDGVTWETVQASSPTFAGIAFGKGSFVADADPVRLSTDGKTWTDGGPLDIGINYRSIDFVPDAGGRFLITGESGTKREIVHSPDGKTWTKAKSRPDACGSYYRGAASGGGVTVLASGTGNVCYSKDGGETWDVVKLADELSSSVVWTGAEFMVWSGATRFHATDGATWQKDVATPASVSIGPVARAADGTLVAANAGWMVWYEKQKFYRSTDGKTWEVAASFTGSHPINFITAGYVEPGKGCPLSRPIRYRRETGARPRGHRRTPGPGSRACET